MRVEDPAVFEATHSLLLRLLAEGKAQGLRVDHVDGLRDPAAYRSQLRTRATEVAEFVPYIVVEKILAPGEEIPAGWPVAGTTGYDWLGMTNGLLVDGGGTRGLDREYRAFTGGPSSFGDIVYRRKRETLQARFQREIRKLASDFAAADGGRIPQDAAAEAIVGLSACLPVYRTYLSPDGIIQRDALYIGDAARQALGRGAHAESIGALRALLVRADSDPESLEFAMRWQQLTSAAMAKGLEDPAFYRFNRLISLNEVGGHAGGVTSTEHHRFVRRRARRWPHSMNATSTHDTKRSEDVRTRLAVLSEMLREWGIQVNAWSSWARSAGAPTIDTNTEYSLWQSALGGWPPSMSEFTSFCERLKYSREKSVREAGESTSWISPDAAYEASVAGFVDWLATNPRARRVRKDLARYAQQIDRAALTKSLGQIVLKLATPGVPDIYQGQEARDFSFVDPDNRRPIDFAARSRILDDLASRDELSLRQLFRFSRGAHAKEFATWRMLQLRREVPDLFELGEYLPLKPSGDGANRVTSFARRHGDRWLIVLAPRLTSRTLGRRVDPDPGIKPALRLPAGCPTSRRDVFANKGVRALGKTLSLVSIVKDSVPIVLRNM